jgi:outer membrane protein assembly factor BamE (lipoprotein component of BamABCDE complex)
LGATVTQDVFQPERWDYLYYATKQGKKFEPRRLTLWFEKEKLARWESEGLPATLPSLNSNTATHSEPSSSE